MNIGSICSGIGAETLASDGLGWKVSFYSEIDKFPSAVLAHHFPDTPNLGDFTKIEASDFPNVEMIVGGPPCQSFSIAGRRGGLSDDRGNLTLNYVDMCHDFATNGSLRWAFYENVPGILSDKTNAFGCLISGLVGADNPFTPPDGESWPKCGMASGPRARLAWRVLDAQYFGLAQRRRRVFIVVGFADGCDPAKVLFERKGVQGNIAQGRSEGQDVAADAGKGAQSPITIDSAVFNRQRTDTYSPEDIASTCAARDYKDATDLVVERPVAFNSRQDPISGEIPGPLDATSPQAQAVAFKPSHYTRGKDGSPSEIVPPLTADADKGDQDAVIATNYAVRRLTPKEAARLQGFPDSWTKIPYRGKPADQCPDGPQYKAYGNTWAVNCVAWIFARIDAVDKDARKNHGPR